MLYSLQARTYRSAGHFLSPPALNNRLFRPTRLFIPRHRFESVRNSSNHRVFKISSTPHEHSAPTHSLITHYAIQCTDVAASAKFFQDFCGLQECHRHGGATSKEPTVWLNSSDVNSRFVLVLFSGKIHSTQESHDYSHLGLAVASRQVVDDRAKQAEEAGCLVLGPKDMGHPVGYICLIRPPAGGPLIEFSYGQELGTPG